MIRGRNPIHCAGRERGSLHCIAARQLGNAQHRAGRTPIAAAGRRCRVYRSQLTQTLAQSTTTQDALLYDALPLEIPRLPPSDGPIVVWFKHDLRVADHPGLLAAAAAAAAGGIVPFFCLDPQQYAYLALMPGGAEALLAALAALRADLQALGNDLVVRIGPTPTTTAALAGSIGAARIIAEREEESRWLEACHELSAALDAVEAPTRITTWQAPVWAAARFNPNYRRWRTTRGAASPPLGCPPVLPALPQGMEPGALPSLAALSQLLSAALGGSAAARLCASSSSRGSSSSNSGRLSPSAADADAAAARAWGGAAGAAARSAVLEGMLSEPSRAAAAAPARRLAALLATGTADGGVLFNSSNNNYNYYTNSQQQNQQNQSTVGSSSSSSSNGRGGSVLPAAPRLSAAALLRGYVQAAGGGGGVPDDSRLAFLRSAAEDLESPAAAGCSLPAMLGPLLGLGVLSARQVLDQALQAEAARWGGRLPPGGLTGAGARAALEAAELADFHRQLAGHIPQAGDTIDERGDGSSTTITTTSSSSSSNQQLQQQLQQQQQAWWPEPVASASSSFEESAEGVQQWGGADWPAGVPRRCNWRWRGALTDYCVVEPRNPRPGAPALVLIHGFGAFGDQWRGNLAPLAEAGYRVYAPTLPGFGRSEKAALQYSQTAWRDFVRDFLVCVVGSPAVLAGNSIGGFISASAAADYPSLVAGLVLVNSAGPITPGVTASDVAAAAAAVKRPPPAWFVRTLTWGLMTYLQGSIAKQLAWLYPTNPSAADGWLEQEIYRAACDARSADVFASVFYLPKPRPLNYLINELWRGPTAVIQGVLDPLNDAQGRADLLRALCPGLRVWALQAGHCPHDEQPEAVNAALLEFVEQSVMMNMEQRQQEASVSDGADDNTAAAPASSAAAAAAGARVVRQ